LNTFNYTQARPRLFGCQEKIWTSSKSVGAGRPLRLPRGNNSAIVFDCYAALPPPVRKASGFPSSALFFLRLGRPRQSLSFSMAIGKPEAFRTGRRHSRSPTGSRKSKIQRSC